MVHTKNYLSNGVGVNSVAMMLLLLDEGWKFESVYVDHGCDWPETREYVQMLKNKGYQITILTPQIEGFSNLYEYAKYYKMIPSRKKRWCTDKFKVKVINQYIERPCFSLIGFSIEENHRAKISSENGIENKFPLIEFGLDRIACKKIIKDHNLPIPIKSGCWFCPFQRVGQWRKLRREHPDLFCKAMELEKQEIEARQLIGKGPLYLNKKPLDKVVNEAQGVLFPEMKPPCYCTQ